VGTAIASTVADGLAVGRGEFDRGLRSNVQHRRPRDAVDSRVRNRDSVAECGRADELAPPQGTQYRLVIDSVQTGDRRRRDFERMPTAVQIDIQLHVARIEPSRDR
jgi:hypothetical protein